MRPFHSRARVIQLPLNIEPIVELYPNVKIDCEFYDSKSQFKSSKSGA